MTGLDPSHQYDMDRVFRQYKTTTINGVIGLDLSHLYDADNVFRQYKTTTNLHYMVS